MFSDALGGAAALSPVMAAKVETAAELKVVAEVARACFLAGADVNPVDLVRTENQAARAERALGIGHQKSAERRPSMRERLLADRAAA